MTRPADDPSAPLPLDRVKEMIGEARVPGAVRDALASGSVRLVRYKERGSVSLVRGPPVGSVGLDERIARRLEKAGAGQLYDYQARAIRRILAGESVAIEAPTAAGKTIAFLAPVAHKVALARGRGTRALLVYPTNALMRDQFGEIEEIAQSVERRAGIMNGDTGQEARKRMEADPPDILLTTFDLLHRQMACRGPLSRMLGTVETLVVDEAHYYNGLLGSNVHHVIARLKRACGGLQCIAASATLKGSAGFCSELFGQAMRVVSGEGQLATVDFAMMAPVMPRKGRDDARALRHSLMVDVAKKATRQKSKTLLFSNSRRGAEIVGVLARDAGLRAGVHRGGMGDGTPVAERDFCEDRLDVLSCTPTLEHGIDIGSVGTVVSEFVPVNRFMQRIGRAGRRGGRGFAVLALGNDPISQYYKNHPEDYDHDEWEPYINPANHRIEYIHTVAMAADSPLEPAEAEERGPAVGRGIAEGLLARDGATVRATVEGEKAASEHKIRGIGKAVRVMCDGRGVGDRSLPHAIGDLHPGALYLRNGSTYRIERLDQHRLIAEAALMPPDTRRHTMPMVEKRVRRKSVLETSAPFGDAEVNYCELEVTIEVNGYVEKGYGNTGGPADARRLERAVRHTFTTNAVEFRAPRPERAMRGAGSEDVEAGSYHAIEHVMVEASRMVIGVTHSDMESKSLSSGEVYVYDRVDGGNGASRALHARMGMVVSRAIGILDGCACDGDEKGCIRCTFYHMCGRNNATLHKKGALESLQRLAGRFGGQGSCRAASAQPAQSPAPRANKPDRGNRGSRAGEPA